MDLVLWHWGYFPRDLRLLQIFGYVSLMYILEILPIPLYGPVAPKGPLFTHFLPNSTHFRQGTLLSHLTFNLEHSSHACRLRPLSNEDGIAEEPRRSQRLKWSLRTSLYTLSCQRKLFQKSQEVLACV
jgi:hypothetical protein